MRSLVYLPLLCAMALGVREAVGMLVCTNTNFCETVDCIELDSDACDGEIQQNATVCGCCPACIRIIPVGDYCPDDDSRVRPGTKRTWECASESVCMNYKCTPQGTTTETTPE